MRDTRRLRLLLALLLLTSFTLLTIDSRSGGGGAFGAVRSAVGTVLDPLQRGVRAVTAPIGRGVSAALDSGRDGRRITDLQRRLAEAQRELDAQRKAGDDVAALRALQQYGFRASFTFLPARVLAQGEAFGGAEQTVTLDVGSADGVTEDMRVASPNGALVGKVRRVVDAHRSLVVLVDDRTSTTLVQLRASKRSDLSEVTGQGPGQPLQLTFGDVTTQLKIGDPLFTVDGTLGTTPVPGGVEVGTISRLEGIQGLAQAAEVTPTVELSALDQVGVLVAQSGPPKRAVLPNAPPPPGGPRGAGAP